MIRKIITVVVPLLAPTLVYILYLWFTYRNKEALAEGRKLPEWRTYPWAILVGSGAILAAISLASVGALRDGTDTGSYVPPRLEDGKIVPGDFSGERN